MNWVANIGFSDFFSRFDFDFHSAYDFRNRHLLRGFMALSRALGAVGLLGAFRG
jgi:hypothetical protein